MAYGYCGKILRVNLTDEVVQDEPLDDELTTKFLGQAGLAAKMLFNEVPPHISAFDPANKLIFMTGPLTGTPVPSGCRYEVVFKSPQTGGFGEANSGGHWATQLKWAGYDGIVVEGCAKEPKVLVITNEAVELRDATHLWGKDTQQTEEMLQQELGEKFKVVSIGPAGENLIRFSAVINDMGRAAARSGPGGVMGSKKLKAIAVKGSKKPELADPDRVRALYKDFIRKLREHPSYTFLSSLGTPGLFLGRELLGYGIVKNWQMDLSEWPGKTKISGQRLNEEFLIKREYCFGCPIGCGRITRSVLDGAPVQVHGPEYESMAALGSQVLNDDMETMITANHLCNILGMDTISAGGVIAFAMECYERGFIPAETLEGKELTWGNSEVILGLLKDIAYRRGKLGALLAEGVKYASKALGEKTRECAVEAKGVESAEHDPRSCQGWGLGYASSNAGARHTEGGVWPEFGNIQTPVGLTEKMDRTTTEGKPRALILMQDIIASAMSSMGLCYITYGFVNLMGFVPDLFEAVTGRKMTIKDFLLCGERSFNVKRVFNAREGIGRKDDDLPVRFTQQPLKEGVSKGIVARAAEMLDEYYQLRGWDKETGWPTKEKLAELSLDKESKALYG